MAYIGLQELPQAIRKLPINAQQIYCQAFNEAWEVYRYPEDQEGGYREGVAHNAAWSAVKRKYRQTETNKWELKS